LLLGGDKWQSMAYRRMLAGALFLQDMGKCSLCQHSNSGDETSVRQNGGPFRTNTCYRTTILAILSKFISLGVLFATKLLYIRNIYNSVLAKNTRECCWQKKTRFYRARIWASIVRQLYASAAHWLNLSRRLTSRRGRRDTETVLALLWMRRTASPKHS
jgi:hypothetical protein